MPVNMEDYSYQLSSKWRLAGMLKLIAVCEYFSLHQSLMVLKQLCRFTELLLGSGNDVAAVVPFGHICLEGSGRTMADYLTVRTMDISYKMALT